MADKGLRVFGRNGNVSKPFEIDENGNLKSFDSGVDAKISSLIQENQTLQGKVDAVTARLNQTLDTQLTGSYVDKRFELPNVNSGNFYFVGNNERYTGNNAGFEPFDVTRQKKKTIIIKDETTVGIKVRFFLTRNADTFTVNNAGYTSVDYNNIIYLSDSSTIQPGGSKIYSVNMDDLETYNSALAEYAYGGIGVQVSRALSGGTGKAIVILTGGM